MTTQVQIEWDTPKDENWLCPDNIALALHAYCKNTKFKVTKIDSNDKVIEAIGWTHADDCVDLDNDRDPRQKEVPEMLDRATKDLKL